ncbi:WD40-repeat-containing domain protein [Suillus paluster]|uniref:WD40-repeat-containing domain protein n=1 Tax=Suillus paluster TaxID=48578 RepID=UPI001B86B65C|nr:WD40-repeat-containing domain protein [Suillus paluster]KAG1752437.1 WD40-repeat-containing domain protein [Suillus paluster]
MISRSWDQTTRRWDLEAGNEIEDAPDICEHQVFVVTVSRDGRWVVTASGDVVTGELLKARDVETGIVKFFEGHSRRITYIDISADSMLLASGAEEFTARIWSLAIGKLVAALFKSAYMVGAVRFSQNSKKFAVLSIVGKHLEVWDVETQTLDISRETHWRRSNKYETSNSECDPMTIYEFDGSTLETVGSPFKGHTGLIRHLTLSFDCALLASASDDNTIKLWAFESRQLPGSFSVQKPFYIIFPPGNSRKMAYTTQSDKKIHICNTPPNILTLLDIHIPSFY